jgi:hypothetical protein
VELLKGMKGTPRGCFRDVGIKSTFIVTFNCNKKQVTERCPLLLRRFEGGSGEERLPPLCAGMK